MTTESDALDNRLFIGGYPCGIVYADKNTIDEDSKDYRRLAFLPYRELEIQWETGVPASLRERIKRHAATIQARRGEQYNTTATGNPITLGV